MQHLPQTRHPPLTTPPPPPNPPSPPIPPSLHCSKGTEVFLTSQTPPYLALTNRMLEQVLGGDGYPEEQVVCAPRLMGVILQHCRGRVDPCVGEWRGEGEGGRGIG